MSGDKWVDAPKPAKPRKTPPTEVELVEKDIQRAIEMIDAHQGVINRKNEVIIRWQRKIARLEKKKAKLEKIALQNPPTDVG